MSVHPRPRANVFIRSSFAYESVDSTSDRAAELVMDGAIPLPMLVRARQQTKGRGRGSHAWWSDAGSLMFTLALEPDAHGLTRDLEPRLALTMAVAIVEAIHELELTDAKVGIRWPNDIECQGLKLGGILPEVVETTRGRRILIGVGLNVTTNLDLAPGEIQAMATSLERISGGRRDELDCDKLLHSILTHFDECLNRLVAADPSLPQLWNGLDLLKNTRVHAQQGPRIISGWGHGIDAEGGLRIRQDDRIVTILGGQILRDRPDDTGQ
jgi:BirA family biotin operon repressor/biotin-[acetyl-CoA-carboxylase] ligase